MFPLIPISRWILTYCMAIKIVKFIANQKFSVASSCRNKLKGGCYSRPPFFLPSDPQHLLMSATQAIIMLFVTKSFASFLWEVTL